MVVWSSRHVRVGIAWHRYLKGHFRAFRECPFLCYPDRKWGDDDGTTEKKIIEH
jgi:hypothetical protein